MIHVYRPLASGDDTTSNGTNSQQPTNRVIASLSGWQMGIRCPNVQIPQRAIIHRVTLRGYNESTKWDTPSQTNWYCEAADNSAAFTATNGDLDNRTKTTAGGAYWSGTNLGASAWYTSDGPMHTMVQEVVNRPGWAPGNALSFISTSNGAEGLQIRGYDATNSPGLGAWAPYVFIEWGPPTTARGMRRRRR